MSIYSTAGLIAGACIAALTAVLLKIAIRTARDINRKSLSAREREISAERVENDDRGAREGAALEATTV